jgi:hypothetical protein
MTMKNEAYAGIPYKFHGDDQEGCDCVGIVRLWLREELGVEVEAPAQYAGSTVGQVLAGRTRVDLTQMVRGDVVFFRQDCTGKIRHVAVYLGGRQFLHATAGGSRVDNGLELLRRAGYTPAGVLGAHQVKELGEALADAGLKEPGTIAMMVIMIVASVAMYFLSPRPKLGQFRDQTGRYGFDQLYTQTNPTLPLPDILGAVCVAGNSPYQELVDRTQPAGNPVLQKMNKVVVLAGGPIEDTTSDGDLIKINGMRYSHFYWHAEGFKLNPAQTFAEAVHGTIGTATNRPSVTVYTGAHGITVPLDIRAQVDRAFPVYGFAGCAYLVFRLIDSSKYSQFTITTTVKGRRCRTFTETGFVVGTVTGEALTGADGAKVRFKLANTDVKEVTGLTVGGTAYSLIAPGNQTGNVFALNATKGYVEFLTAPGSGASVAVSYTYYPREWTQNPAMHLVYLLTEKQRGKGMDESRIAWPRAVALRDYCDELVPWPTSSGMEVGPRFRTNYVIDSAKSIQDHMRAILDGCYATLFMSDGKVIMKARKAEVSVFSFNSTNILVERSGDDRATTFSAELAERSSRPNRVRLYYHSAETLNSETEVVREDVVDQDARAPRFGNDGVLDDTVKVEAVDSHGQAERLAEMMLREGLASKWIVEFKTTIKGLALEPGDVVDVTNDVQPGWDQKLMRVEGVSLDAQDRMTLQCSEYVPEAYI